MIAEFIELAGVAVVLAEDGGDCPESPATAGITGDREDLVAWLTADAKRTGARHYTILARGGAFTIWRRS